ncbi:MAG: nuclear transport factor 2 family protein [Rhodanobacteraceae bacterium]
MRTVLRALVFFFVCGAHAAPTDAVNSRAGVDAFNRAFDQATRNMDNAATLALWEDNGVSLLPSTAPIIGKKAIATFMDDVLRQLPGAHMKSFEDRCFDIQISGDLASEWCQEHQVVTFNDGKPPFDGRGKMLLVLHRGAEGHWRLRQEMWNQAATEPVSK